MYAAESAMDELAVELGVAPIELRERNEPEVDPETGKPWSDRSLVRCLREVANAAHHATGVRVRNLPLTPDRFLVGPGE